MKPGPRAWALRLAIRRYGWIYLVLTIPVIHFCVYRAYPIIDSLVLSFYKFGILHSTWIGLSNYVDLAHDEIFWVSLKNTVVYTLGTVPLGLLISLVLAAFIVRLSVRLQVFFKSAFYLPGVASAVVLSMIWVWIFNPNIGLLNYLLSLVGLAPVRWLADPHWAMPALIFSVLTGEQGLSVILLCAAIGNIPRELYEAGRIDGATAGAEFRFITIPLARPAIVYLLITGTIASFQVFTNVYLMTKGGPGYATTTLVYVLYKIALGQLQYGLASAIAMVLLVITILLALAQYRGFAGSVEY